MRNAVRRRPIHRHLRCGAHPAGRARLPAFHRGSAPRDSRIPRCDSGPGFAALAPWWRGSPAGAGPVAASTSRAGHNAGRHDVRNRPGTACKAAHGRRPRPTIRLASGPPPSRRRGLCLITKQGTNQAQSRKNDDSDRDLSRSFRGVMNQSRNDVNDTRRHLMTTTDALRITRSGVLLTRRTIAGVHRLGVRRC
jgi:hypothetical protein